VHCHSQVPAAAAIKAAILFNNVSGGILAMIHALHLRFCRALASLALSGLALMLVSLPAGAAVSIAATATGSSSPATIDVSLDLVNGDFFIAKNPAAGLGHVTGDGVDETTTWTFDFTNDPNYANFPSNGTLTVALLTLTLTTVFDPGPVTDLVRPLDLFPIIPIPLFLTGPGAKTGNIEFALLALGYNSGQLLTFFTGNNGLFPMIYADDAIVSFARLDLTAVPIPAAAWMFGAALIPLARVMRRSARRA
jgi:hypothetical protein